MSTFQHQVGGHPLTILSLPPTNSNTNKEENISENGSTLIKTLTEKELNFYTNIGPQLNPEFIGVWTPTFYGTLTLQGKLNEDGKIEKSIEVEEEESKEGKEMLVLENLTHRFIRPNVLDVKLGIQLYEDDAPIEKKIRMKKAARDTTSFETGIRLTGFQVWDSISQNYVKTNKIYGKALWEQHLPEALSKFFILPPPYTFKSEFSSTTSTQDLYESTSIPTSIAPLGLPIELIRQVLIGILSQLYQLREVVNHLEFRMRGGSILIIFEGDKDALNRALENEKEVRRVEFELSNGKGKGKEKESDVVFEENIMEKVGTEETMEVEKEEEGEEEEEGSQADSLETSDSQGVALPHTLLSLDVRLIDFAHTSAAPGQGPDLGVLKGIDYLSRLLEGLVKDIDDVKVEKV